MIRSKTKFDYSRTLPLAELAKVSGAKKRSAQFWTANGALQCDPETRHQGPGVHRQYDLSEGAVAIVLARIAKRTLSVGELIQAGSGTRSLFGLRKLESPEQAAKRRKEVCAKYGESALDAKKHGPRAVTAVEQAKNWEGFIRALHGQKGQRLILTSSGKGNWKVEFHAGGVRMRGRLPEGETLTWEYGDAAKLFRGLLR